MRKDKINNIKRQGKKECTSSSSVPRSLVGMNRVWGVAAKCALRGLVAAGVPPLAEGLRREEKTMLVVMGPTSASIRLRRSTVSVLRMADRSV